MDAEKVFHISCEDVMGAGEWRGGRGGVLIFGGIYGEKVLILSASKSKLKYYS